MLFNDCVCLSFSLVLHVNINQSVEIRTDVIQLYGTFYGLFPQDLTLFMTDPLWLLPTTALIL